MMPPEVPGDPAREGTCAAWVAEMVLTGQAKTTAELVGKSHENGWVVTPDMAQHIAKYVDSLRACGGTMHVERKVRLNKHIAGTPDGYAVLDPQAILKVKDLKYGYEIVEPYRNTQVSIYAGAILRGLVARGVVINRVEISIYQPRAWHPLGVDRVWVIRPEELMAFVHEIEAAGERCQNPMALAQPGDHCHYCPAASTCAANAHEVYRIAAHVTAGQQRHMRPDEMAEELKFLTTASEMITGRLKAVRTEAEARVGRGERIPGWHMESGAGQRRWKLPAATVKALTGMDLSSDATITPAEAERRGMNVDLVKSLTETPRLTPKLKPIPAGFYTQLFARKEK